MSEPSYPSMLRGNPLISLTVGRWEKNDTPRTCGCCIFRNDNNSDCQAVSRSTHHAFQIPNGESLPQQLNGVEVGPYCQSWVHFADD